MGVGFCIGNQQEAYGAKFFATMGGIYYLASRVCGGRSFTILTDTQAAIVRIQSDAPGPGQDMAAEAVGLANTL